MKLLDKKPVVARQEILALGKITQTDAAWIGKCKRKECVSTLYLIPWVIG